MTDEPLERFVLFLDRNHDGMVYCFSLLLYITLLPILSKNILCTEAGDVILPWSLFRLAAGGALVPDRLDGFCE